MFGIGEFLPTQIPPYTQDPRCSAKFEWNSGRTVPICWSAWMTAFLEAAGALNTPRGSRAAREAAAVVRANWRRVGRNDMVKLSFLGQTDST